MKEVVSSFPYCLSRPLYDIRIFFWSFMGEWKRGSKQEEEKLGYKS